MRLTWRIALGVVVASALFTSALAAYDWKCHAYGAFLLDGLVCVFQIVMFAKCPYWSEDARP